MAAVTGDGGDVTVGTTALNVIEWSGYLEATEHDYTNVASGGWDQTTLGNRRFSGSAKAYWDSEINAGAPPYPLVTPQTGVEFTLGISADAGTYEFEGVISKLSITNAVDKLIEYSFDFKSNGAVVYTAPAGGGGGGGGA